jgi:hypothetical protein
MSTKQRVIQADDGRFYPQFKPGWFYGWRFYNRKPTMPLVVWMEECDPAQAASFATEQEAQEFVVKVLSERERYWDEKLAAEQRAFEGIPIRRIINN